MNVANQFTTNADGTVTLYLYQNKTEFGALPIEVRLSKKNIPMMPFWGTWGLLLSQPTICIRFCPPCRWRSVQ